MPKLTGVVLTVNYPDDEAEAAIPNEMTVAQLAAFLQKLVDTEPDVTSFVLTAAIQR